MPIVFGYGRFLRTVNAEAQGRQARIMFVQNEQESLGVGALKTFSSVRALPTALAPWQHSKYEAAEALGEVF